MASYQYEGEDNSCQWVFKAGHDRRQIGFAAGPEDIVGLWLKLSIHDFVRLVMANGGIGGLEKWRR